MHYAETHIPLLISLPGQNRSYTEAENGDLSDIAPTILAVLGIGKPSWMDGHVLIGAARNASPPQPSISMYLSQSSAFSKPAVGTIAANCGPYRLVLYFPSGRVELFDIARDPEETHAAFASASQGMAMPLIRDIQRRFCDSLDSGPPVCSP